MATSEFGKAFSAARKEMGPGKTFPFKGKIYSTDMASDKKSSSAPKKAPVPKERPSMPKREPSDLKGRNAGRVSRSMDDTPKPKRSGYPRRGTRGGVKMK